MKIRILTIGQKMPAWVLTGFEDYFKRIQPFVQTQIIELPMAKRGKNDSEADILKYRQIEGDSILNAMKGNEVLIALSISAVTNPTAQIAYEKLSALEGTQAHSTVMLNKDDEQILKRLGMDITSDPVFSSENLFYI